MKRWIAMALAILCVGLAGCAETQEQPQQDPLVTAYLDAANKHMEAGDLDIAIAVLEEGLPQTGGNSDLATRLEDIKAEKAKQETTVATEATTVPTEAPTEASTEAPTEAPAETTVATEAQPLVSGYPIQIDMDDMLSANILGMTFYSAYESGSLDSWMSLYVNGSSDPEVGYESRWFDPVLQQMTYYGILHQQAIDAGWGDIWMEMVTVDATWPSG